MAKIERKFMAHYVDAAAPGDSGGGPTYVRLGKDLEEYSPELSANVEKKNNILGETSTMLTNYEKSGSVEPYYAEKGDALFERLQAIVDGCLVLDDCNTTVVEVHLWEEEDPEKGFPAIKDDAVIEVVSYGGDSSGYQIPFNLHYKAAPVKGFFKVDTKTFTAEETA